MTQIEMETMTAIKNYCRQNTPSHRTARLAVATEVLKALISNPSVSLGDINADDYSGLAQIATLFADALMAECGKGGKA